MKIAGIVNTFMSESKLIEWLENKNWDCGSPEAFDEWLQNYFDNGNEIEVCGETYDYWACRELI